VKLCPTGRAAHSSLPLPAALHHPPAPRLLPCPAAPLAGIEGLPEAANEEMLEDEDFLKAFHHALLEVHLEEGALVCPETGEEWDIKGG
jgi:hypothetical protein